MSEPKRIIFSTETPNDQGGVIPNDCLDFSRFSLNPVVLMQHKWDELPLGMLTDIQYINGQWTAIPVFHKLTEDSRTYSDLYEAGYLRACSIGGEAIWKTTGRFSTDKDGKRIPEFERDVNGNRVCARFVLYEVSMVTLPSNPDAVTMADTLLGAQVLDRMTAKVYESLELETINSSINTLSSKFKTMQPENEPAQTTTAAATPAAPVATPEPTTLSVEPNNELPGFLEKIISKGLLSALKEVFAGKPDVLASEPLTSAPKNDEPKPDSSAQPVSTQPSTTTPAQPTPVGLKSQHAEQAKQAAENARMAAEQASNKLKDAKLKAETEGATEGDKSAYNAAATEAEKCLQAAIDADTAYKAAKQEAEEEKDGKKPEKEEEGKEKSTNTAQPAAPALPAPANPAPKEIVTNNSKQPQMKTLEELKAENASLAAPPTQRVTIGAPARGLTFSKLATALHKNDSSEEATILSRVMAKDADGKNLADYQTVLHSIINDGKYSAIIEKTRFMQNVGAGQLQSFQKNVNTRAGLSIKDVAARLDSGMVNVLGRDNVMRQMTTLGATDDFLASPDLLAVEFLPLAIFKLFPTTSWKNDIPMFGAQMTGENTGVIWANIAADPEVYKGNKPTPAAYTYSDQAVALSLIPYWLQPMQWTPLTMHQLRYDQMSTGWAQAFAKWGAIMDDDLLYTLASTVPASSIIKTSGPAFNITGPTDPNAFIFSPNFNGQLAAPLLNDVISLEQIYNKQNFQLKDEKATLVLDSTADALIAKDPETKSLLTRWVGAEGAEMLKFKNTLFNQRSRVAVYDPATGQVKDPDGVIPNTAVSACVGFLPSQVGMGLGMLDVFMVQNPAAYGYEMSADIRIGIVPLRKDYSGTTLLTYGQPNV